MAKFTALDLTQTLSFCSAQVESLASFLGTSTGEVKTQLKFTERKTGLTSQRRYPLFQMDFISLVSKNTFMK